MNSFNQFIQDLIITPIELFQLFEFSGFIELNETFKLISLE